jgi:hypothetical protein
VKTVDIVVGVSDLLAKKKEQSDTDDSDSDDAFVNKAVTKSNVSMNSVGGRAKTDSFNEHSDVQNSDSMTKKSGGKVGGFIHLLVL